MNLEISYVQSWEQLVLLANLQTRLRVSDADNKINLENSANTHKYIKIVMPEWHNDITRIQDLQSN